MQAGTLAPGDEREAFVSHSTKDREVAEWVCAQLETHGISVWLAPRDVRPGRNYAEEIIHAIESTRLTIVVLSENANASVHVQHEVERAVSKGKIVFPVRVADVAPARALELFVSSAQWIDLFGPGREAGIAGLVRAAKDHLGQSVPRVVAARAVHIPAPAVSAPRRRSTAPLVLAAVLLIALAAAGVAWQRGLLSRGPELVVNVQGAPEAELHLDGRLVGRAVSGQTKHLAATAGSHALRVEAPGYWPYERNLDVEAGGEPLEVKLAKKSSLVVTVATSGAKVALNGEAVRKPFPLELPDGQYTVDVTADGHEPYRQVVALAGGQQQAVTVSLAPVKKAEPPPPRAARRDDDDRRAERHGSDSTSFNPRENMRQEPQQAPNVYITTPGGRPGIPFPHGFGGFPHP